MSPHSPTTPAPGPVVLQIAKLGAPPWATQDPFLFCVHHDDAYPAGNDQLGPAASLAGRDLGQDFAGKDGWRMYHGRGRARLPAAPPPRLRDRDHRAARRSSITPTRSARRRASAAATCSGSRRAAASSTRRCSRCSSRERPTRSSSSRSGSTCRGRQARRRRTSPCSGTRTSRGCVVTDDAGRTHRGHRRRRRARRTAPAAPPPRSWASRAGHRRRDLDPPAWSRARSGRCRPRGSGETDARSTSSAAPAPRAGEPMSAPTAIVVRGDAPRSSRRTTARARFAPPGTPHRRAGGAVRALRHEHPRGVSSRPSRTTSARASAAGPGRATTRCSRAKRRFAKHADGSVERAEEST